MQPSRDKPRLTIHKRCKHLIEEMRKYRWLKKKETTSSGMAPAVRVTPLKKDDDCVDCCRYLLMSVAANKGVQPSSTRSYDTSQHRSEVQLVRPGNGRTRLAPTQAATAGFFRR